MHANMDMRACRNYPFQCAILPLVGAISAGCTAILKPSEVSAHTSALIKSLVPRYLDKDAFFVFEGGPEVAQALLKVEFAKIFFTGSTSLGKVVYKAAAEHLTPVVLELGGKSPVIIDKNVDMVVAAKRVVSGKCMNAGQTCVAPDYVLVHEDVHAEFVKACASQIAVFYGKNPKTSPDFARIINQRHTQRLVSLLKSLNHEAKVLVGGLDSVDEKEKYVPPTIITNVDPSCAVMQEEIFGPILPVLKVKSIKQAITFINNRPHPLACYVFSKSSPTISQVLHTIRFSLAAR